MSNESYVRGYNDGVSNVLKAFIEDQLASRLPNPQIIIIAVNPDTGEVMPDYPSDELKSAWEKYFPQWHKETNDETNTSS